MFNYRFDVIFTPIKAIKSLLGLILGGIFLLAETLYPRRYILVLVIFENLRL